jgi:subtilisin family serine protease
MPQSSLRRRTLLLVLVVFALQGAAVARPAMSAQASSLNPMPADVALSLPLGQTQTLSIALANTSDATLTPAIYEAWPAPTASSLAALPATPVRVALPKQSTTLDPALVAALQAAPDKTADFVVYLREQADLSAAYTIADWNHRGRYVYETLTHWAQAQQAGLRQTLAARGLAYRSLWIVNAVQVHGTLGDAQALAGQAEVALVRANHLANLPPTEAQPSTLAGCSPDQPANPTCWNIRKIGAERVWREFGVTGQGIVVASIDTGVSYSHPALSASYRGYRGPGQYDHNYNWLDPLNGTQAPHDPGYHGTHTMGTIAGVGDGSAERPAIGVAPGAHWISAAGCSSGACTEGDLIASAQWMLAPTALDQTRPRPDLRPMIINNSWSGARGNDWFAGYTTAWRAAGIFPVFAAGNNYDQQCGSIMSPADYPDVVGVGATDAGDTIAPFSLLGPTSDGRLKPDFSAPGRSIVSATPVAGGYRALDGTSMAAPHIAGAVALLWSANPALIGDYDSTYALLRDTAQQRSDTRCGDAPGAPNNIYGQGRIDVFTAVARARIDVPWLLAPASVPALAPGASANLSVTLDTARVPGPGTYTARLQIYGGDLGQPPTTIPVKLTVTSSSSQAQITGRVISAEDGAALSASVSIFDGARVATDASGVYTLTVVPAMYTLVASAPSYLSRQQTVHIKNDMRLPDFQLQPDQPRLVLPTTTISTTLAHAERRTLALPLDNQGTQPLHYSLSVPQDFFGAWRSDEPGGPSYQWIDLPTTALTLTLGDNTYTDEVRLGIDFPLFSNSYTETVVTSDGTLAFSEPQPGYSGPSSRCLPGFEMLFDVIAPFRADLDPARGGSVRYGTLPDKKTFVLSYENVPLHSGPITQTYTFQALLHDDGRIGFQYKHLDALPDALSVGIQKNYPPYGQPEQGYQQLACGLNAPLHDGLAIELRPQTPSAAWLGSDTREGIIPPGAQEIVSISLVWQRPQGNQLLRARILVDSSDRMHPAQTVPVEVAAQPAPIEYWLGSVFLGR